MRLSGSLEALCVVVLMCIVTFEAEANCTPNYCSNGGVCWPVEYGGNYYKHCDCYGLSHFGYTCEIPKRGIYYCPNNHIGYHRCLHHSHCYYDPYGYYSHWPEFHKGYYCECSGTGYWGDHCQHYYCRGITVIKNCKSKKNKFKKCKVASKQYKVVSVQVIKVKSKAGCVHFGGLPSEYHGQYGVYGFYDNFIWVSNNCNGQFQVCLELVYDHCNSSPCIHGYCYSGLDGFSCTCHAGYWGTHCDKVDYCHMNPCKHGICHQRDNSYYCDCTGTGYWGTHCDKVDYCHLNPCKHGICHSRDNSYYCDCTGTGYWGNNCHKVDYIHASPFKQYGVCHNLDNNYYYECNGTGYWGTNCHFIDYCHSIPCKHYGVCHNRHNNYYCDCTGTGYWGNNCHKVDYCHSNPCKHGICHNYQNSYYCDCTNTGYWGTHCHLVDYCHYNPCQNYGICHLYQNSYYCVCRTGYWGPYCQYWGRGDDDDDDDYDD